jgi:hypothetical protein
VITTPPINRLAVRDKAKNTPPPDYTTLGGDAEWAKSWRVLMHLVVHQTDEQFAELEPNFNRAHRRFKSYIARFKHKPKEGQPYFAARYGDTEFKQAADLLIGNCLGSRLFADPASFPNRKQEIGTLIHNLKKSVEHWPK